MTDQQHTGWTATNGQYTINTDGQTVIETNGLHMTGHFTAGTTINVGAQLQVDQQDGLYVMNARPENVTYYRPDEHQTRYWLGMESLTPAAAFGRWARHVQYLYDQVQQMSWLYDGRRPVVPDPPAPQSDEDGRTAWWYLVRQLRLAELATSVLYTLEVNGGQKLGDVQLDVQPEIYGLLLMYRQVLGIQVDKKKLGETGLHSRISDQPVLINPIPDRGPGIVVKRVYNDRMAPDNRVQLDLPTEPYLHDLMIRRLSDTVRANKIRIRDWCARYKEEPE